MDRQERQRWHDEINAVLPGGWKVRWDGNWLLMNPAGEWIDTFLSPVDALRHALVEISSEVADGWAALAEYEGGEEAWRAEQAEKAGQGADSADSADSGDSGDSWDRFTEGERRGLNALRVRQEHADTELRAARADG